MLTVACVDVGVKYPRHYVTRLQQMVAKWLWVPHRFICLTDDPEPIPNVESVNIGWTQLAGWWAKMALFDPEIRGPGPCLYFDLDTIITGTLAPLADARYYERFGICANFTRAAGNTRWPCRYGSCVMTFPAGWGAGIWQEFRSAPDDYMHDNPKGDQQLIEHLVPNAVMLQDNLPPGYFVGYRELYRHPLAPPPGASIIVYGGREKPHNTPLQWARNAWRGEQSAADNCND